ncbi:MAG: WYL domain-containing transcriptional regulator [Myxococcota bacterium]|nr:WYL domain-containing transcriptional regulator [Myxococcota bacterium]
MSLNKAQKLVKIVELLQRRGGVRAVDLMGRFELDPRTMRRYMADLRDMGIPLDDVGVGDERILSLDSTYRRTGMNLTLTEVLSLHFGRKLFTFLDGTQFAADMDDAIERLEPAISRAHADLASHLDRKFMAVAEHSKDYTEMGDLIDELITSLIYDNPARAEYAKPGNTPSVKELEPLTLATYRQGLYLFARDRGDDRIKTFAVERFTAYSRLRLEHFQPPTDWNPEAHIKDAFGIMNNKPVDVVAVFDSQSAPYVRERTWHPSQSLEPLPDGSLRCRFHVGLGPELEAWLLGFGGSVSIEEPSELRDTLRAHHQQALERLS